MEIQGSIGGLTEAVRNLNSNIEKQNETIGKLEEKLSGVTQKIYAAGVVLAVLLVIGGFVVDKAWDLVADQVKVSAGTLKQKSP